MEIFYTVLSVTYLEIFIFMLISFFIGYFLRPVSTSKMEKQIGSNNEEKSEHMISVKKDVSSGSKDDRFMEDTPQKLRVIKTRERGGWVSSQK